MRKYIFKNHKFKYIETGYQLEFIQPYFMSGDAQKIQKEVEE